MKHLDRLPYWANRGEDWKPMAKQMGVSYYERDPGTFLLMDSDDRVIAIMRRTLDEWCLFVFKPQARTPRLRRFAWRVRHPLTPLLLNNEEPTDA